MLVVAWPANAALMHSKDPTSMGTLEGLRFYGGAAANFRAHTITSGAQCKTMCCALQTFTPSHASQVNAYKADGFTYNHNTGICWCAVKKFVQMQVKSGYTSGSC